MKPNLLLCLAPVLSGGLLNCSAGALRCCDVQSPKAASVAKVELKVVKVDSEETDGVDNYGKNAVDGNPNTYWHTQWHDKSPGLPHEIIIELHPPSVIKGFTYLPRQDESDHGTIKDYEFYVSNDGKHFGQPVKKGAFEPGKGEEIETFKSIECRFIKLTAISEINGLPWTSAAEIRVIQCGEDTSVKTYQINQAMSQLAEFDKNKSIDQLESAFRAVERISPPGVDKIVPRSVARQEQAKMWLNLLATIDQNIDPSFDDPHDPKNSYALNVAPPPTPEGIRYPPGVDPKEIKDPKTRAQYEAAIKENDEKKARGIFQTGLRNINELAVLDVGRFFPTYYTSSKEDQSELENLMQQAKLSPGRAHKLKALFEAQFLFTANNDTITITGYTGSDGAVVIPETIDRLPVVSIGNGAFSRRISITSVVIPDTVTNIGDSAFDYMDTHSRLTGLKIGRKVARIGSFAFSACDQLTNITIPDSVISIGRGAFLFCTRLTGITIPASVTNIEDRAFNACFSLKSITVDAGNPAYCSVDGVLYDKNRTRLLQFPGGKAGSYIIPNGVTNIAHLALWNCPYLTSVTMPEGVTSIGDEEFAACHSLVTVTVPASVTNIGPNAFNSCMSVKGIYFCGNAPDYGEYWRGGRAKVLGGLDTGTVYYRQGTTGWGTNFGGRPTALWKP